MQVGRPEAVGLTGALRHVHGERLSSSGVSSVSLRSIVGENKIVPVMSGRQIQRTRELRLGVDGRSLARGVELKVRCSGLGRHRGHRAGELSGFSDPV